MNLPEQFLPVLERLTGTDNMQKALSSFEGGGFVSVRINPYKSEEGVPGTCRKVPWSRYGYFLDSRPVFTLDPYFHAGGYYVQDSSSMYVGYVFSEICSFLNRPLRILDLCAAPGGKTTDIASLMPEGSVLVSNEVMGQRVSVLKENVAVWGNPDIFVTSNDPKDFGMRLKGYFDIIVADVPCSGEGMFRKDPQAIAHWSPDNVELCAARQKRILADCWDALAPGGYLIYSTCTFNSQENLRNVIWMEETFGAERIVIDCPSASGTIVDDAGGRTFVWGLVPGEGQYCAAVRKPDGESGRVSRLKPAKAFSSNVSDMLAPGCVLVQARDSVKAYTRHAYEQSSLIEQSLKVVHSGLMAGTLKGRDFIPDADLALSELLRRGCFPEYDLGLEDALKFLSRENIPHADLPKGYILVTYKGVPLGFVKNIGNRFNSLHPQGRRIRMDIRQISSI